MSNILSALFYLRITSFKNAALSRLKRLKQPKYLVGAIIGVAYIYFFYFRRFTVRRGSGSAALASTLSADTLQIVLAIGAVIFLAILALCWIFPRARASLNFKEAEIAFLFPAPVSRRALIHYRLVGSQTGILFLALILGLVSGGWGFLQGNAAIRIAGWWIIYATFTLHFIGSSFVITRLLDRGVTSLRRQLVTLGVIALIIAVIAWLSRDMHAPSAGDFTDFKSFTHYLSTLLASGPLPWLLLPAKWVIGPMFAADARSFLVALGPALLMYAAHYVWVLQAEVSFEEASIAKAEKRAAKVAAMREGKYRVGRSAPKARSEPFGLANVKRPELAFLWKNLLSTAEYLRPRTAMITAAIIVMGCTWLANHPVYQATLSTVGFVAMMMSAYLLALGPQIARQDLRSDLMNADILKTYPLHGWQIVLGEILTPVAIVTVLLWLTLLTASLSFQPRRMEWLTPQLRITVALGLACIAPLLCTLQLLVVNSAAVLFPAWMQTSRNRGAPTIEGMGQRIFFLFGQLFVMVVTLIPAVLAAAIVFFISRWLVGIPLATALSGVVVLAILGVEVWLGISWLGQRFERFDLSAELRP